MALTCSRALTAEGVNISMKADWWDQRFDITRRFAMCGFSRGRGCLERRARIVKRTASGMYRLESDWYLSARVTRYAPVCRSLVSFGVVRPSHRAMIVIAGVTTWWK